MKDWGRNSITQDIKKTSKLKVGGKISLLLFSYFEKIKRFEISSPIQHLVFSVSQEFW